METSQIVGAAKLEKTLEQFAVAARVIVEASHEPEQMNEILSSGSCSDRCWIRAAEQDIGAERDIEE